MSRCHTSSVGKGYDKVIEFCISTGTGGSEAEDDFLAGTNGVIAGDGDRRHSVHIQIDTVGNYASTVRVQNGHLVPAAFGAYGYINGRVRGGVGESVRSSPFGPVHS